MKIINYLIIGLVIALIISILFNIRSCESKNEPYPIDRVYQRKMDSLVFLNRGLSSDLAVYRIRLVKSDSLVSKLLNDMNEVQSKLDDAKLEIDIRKRALMETNKKIKQIENTDITLSEQELLEYFRKKIK